MGPGAWIDRDGRMGLGHRRLSIIDLADAAQPMPNEDRNPWIAFNGERSTITDDQTRIERTADNCWRTDHPDTEVIPHVSGDGASTKRWRSFGDATAMCATCAGARWLG